MRAHYILCAFGALCVLSSVAHADSRDAPPLGIDGLSFSSFVDTYLAHDFNDPETDTRLYTTQALREDRARLNLAYIDAKLDRENWRGRAALQIGDSVTSNYSAEKHESWQYVQEATIGYRLTDRLWLDGGLYLAHIGLESFISRDNWTYTRSLVAEYSPYYETGVKLSYQFSDTWTGQLHLLRGWQNISNDSDLALGTQLQWTPSSEWQLTYNNFAGDVSGTRVFNEVLAKYTISPVWSTAVQLDLGTQDRKEATDSYWRGWALLAQYKATETVAFGGRVERYSDPHQVVLSTTSGASFNAVGLSANVDWEILPKLLWRTEYKVYVGQNEVFPKDSGFSKNDQLVVTSLSFSY